MINFQLLLNGDEEYCAVHLVNRGWRVEDNEIIVEFSTTGMAPRFLCSLNREEFKCKFGQSLYCSVLCHVLMLFSLLI